MRARRYARHFLTSCKRLLGLEYDFHPGGLLGVRDQKREVLVQVSHMGIEPEVLDAAQHSGAAAADGSVTGQLNRWRESGKTILIGIDEMER